MESNRKVYKNKIEWRNEKLQFHRLDGPAVECGNGHKEWWINGKLHREDGPAIIFNNIEYYYLNDIEYSEEQYPQEVIKLKIKRLVNEERISQ